eukprot:1152162-Pelagomonas_calceolata.AAC.8
MLLDAWEILPIPTTAGPANNPPEALQIVKRPLGNVSGRTITKRSTCFKLFGWGNAPPVSKGLLWARRLAWNVLTVLDCNWSQYRSGGGELSPLLYARSLTARVDFSLLLQGADQRDPCSPLAGAPSV